MIVVELIEILLLHSGELHTEQLMDVFRIYPERLRNVLRRAHALQVHEKNGIPYMQACAGWDAFVGKSAYNHSIKLASVVNNTGSEMWLMWNVSDGMVCIARIDGPCEDTVLGSKGFDGKCEKNVF